MSKIFPQNFPQKMIASSILSADFANLEKEIDFVTRAGAGLIHVDVMDGHFVPNLTIGMSVVKSLKPIAKIPLDVHLMIEKPEKYIKEFILAGSSCLTLHVESTSQMSDNLKLIKSMGCKAGITLRPKTSIDEIKPYLQDVDLVLIMTVEPGFGGQSFMKEQLEKVKFLTNFRTQNSSSFLIEVDGGINPETAPLCWAAGADILVAGSAVFRGEKSVQNYAQNIHSLLK